jgi:hypothetical protein
MYGVALGVAVVKVFGLSVLTGAASTALTYGAMAGVEVIKDRIEEVRAPKKFIKSQLEKGIIENCEFTVIEG